MMGYIFFTLAAAVIVYYGYDWQRKPNRDIAGPIMLCPPKIHY